MAMDPEYQRAFFDVATEHGVPVVVSKTGWKTIEIDGKKYLTPMSEDECKSFREEKGLGPPQSEWYWCNVDASGNCIGVHCGKCERHVDGGRVWCECKYEAP